MKAYLPKATDAKQIILDGEILLMDTETHSPLPFGTLGVHKKENFKVHSETSLEIGMVM